MNGGILTYGSQWFDLPSLLLFDGLQNLGNFGAEKPSAILLLQPQIFGDLLQFSVVSFQFGLLLLDLIGLFTRFGYFEFFIFFLLR